jgi:hypothetical protein
MTIRTLTIEKRTARILIKEVDSSGAGLTVLIATNQCASTPPQIRYNIQLDCSTSDERRSRSAADVRGASCDLSHWKRFDRAVSASSGGNVGISSGQTHLPEQPLK